MTRVGCQTKTRFDNPTKARKVAALASERTGEKITAYRCPWGCGGWHIGHPPDLQALKRMADAIRRW